MGCTGYVIGGIFLGYRSPGMLPLILFNLISILINVIQCLRIILEKRSVFLPNELRNLYNTVFQKMTTKEFMKIYQLSYSRVYKQGDILTIQGKPVSELIVIKKGCVQILKDDLIFKKLGEGYFIGEMSYLTKSPASATVIVADEDVECIQWNQERLNKLEYKNRELYEKFKESIVENLIKKIHDFPVENPKDL